MHNRSKKTSHLWIFANFPAARAIFQKPLLLILDEATSALDSESEQIVQQALDELLKSQHIKQEQQQQQENCAPMTSAAPPPTTTTVVIAHRLCTVENADYIAVLRNGCVAEFGPPQQLLSNPNGLYSVLVDQARLTGRIAE